MDRESLTTDTAKTIWAGDFGNEYSDRNDKIEDYELRYKNDTGFTQQEIFEKFFQDFDRDISILEIGCNRGLKLSMLKEMGFTNISAIEVNQKAYELAKKENPTAKIFHSSIENFDSKSTKYDLVFTSTLLIHIPPDTLEIVISKMINLSKKYIFGLEFYSDELIEIPYRGLTKALWKQNFPKIFQKISQTLTVKKIQFLPYKNEKLSDVIYLLEKN
jgi:pseudaminic acid biosynthesis-associated methylase